MISRRLVMVGAAAFATRGFVPVSAQGRVRTIGWLGIGDAETGGEFLDAFIKGMRSLGYEKRRDFVLEERWAAGASDKVARLADELVALNPDVIVAEGARGAEAASRATSTIPIVAPVVSERTAAALAGGNYASPSGNVTGIGSVPDTVVIKLFEIAREVVPGASRVGALLDTALPRQGELADSAAASLPITLLTAWVTQPADLAPAIDGLAARGAQVVVAPSSALFRAERRQIARLAAAARLPLLYANKIIVEAGGLAAYGVDTTASFERAARLVDRILRGARPADLPIEQLTPMLTINLGAAKALDFTFPPSILARADEVIE